VTATARPSLHLSWEELACHDGTAYPAQWRASRLRVLCGEFEAVRRALTARVGRAVPITVNSAYRTPAYNQRKGGSPRSQHLEGRALDLALPQAPSLLGALYTVVRERAESHGVIRGIGRYETFVHLDVRPGTHLALWDLRTSKEPKS